uniref:presenilin-associated rhomboid-like protein, mitochondrial n=1 Tax=Centroberyx gerrardi TaxID=166262 RepID=UPI003AAA788B
MTVLAAVCTKMPEAKLAIIFLPMYTFTASNALKAIVAMDTAGVVLGWRFFDHAAHLGGAMFGIWYILFGHELIWKNREPFVKVWHDLRTRGGGGGGGGTGSM